MSSRPKSTTGISEALILMAGSGSRLRGADETFLKPLVPIHGQPLVRYTIDALARAGVGKITAVIGFEGERLGAALNKLVPAGIELKLIENHEWQKQNGISVLAAKDQVSTPFLLTMSDHLFDPSIVDLLIQSADLNCLNVAVDKKINSIFDLADAMKLQIENNRVIAIGKGLKDYNGIDTGLFVCPLSFFDYLEQAKSSTPRRDCSLADGVRLMAARGAVRGVDIGEGWWQDVDTPEMLAQAERHLRDKIGIKDASTRAQA